MVVVNAFVFACLALASLESLLPEVELNSSRVSTSPPSLRPPLRTLAIDRSPDVTPTRFLSRCVAKATRQTVLHYASTDNVVAVSVQKLASL